MHGARSTARRTARRRLFSRRGCSTSQSALKTMARQQRQCSEAMQHRNASKTPCTCAIAERRAARTMNETFAWRQTKKERTKAIDCYPSGQPAPPHWRRRLSATANAPSTSTTHLKQQHVEKGDVLSTTTAATAGDARQQIAERVGQRAPLAPARECGRLCPSAGPAQRPRQRRRRETDGRARAQIRLCIGRQRATSASSGTRVERRFGFCFGRWSRRV